MNNSKITINVESLDNDTIKANFKGGAKNFDQLIQLGGAVLQTFLNSAADIIKKNNGLDMDMPDEILQLTILDALVDKVGNFLQMNREDETDESKVDDFLSSILNGMKGDE